MLRETIFQLCNTVVGKITKAKPHYSWLYLEEKVRPFYCPNKSSLGMSGISIWVTSFIRMKTWCQTGKSDNGATLETCSAPHIGSEWNTWERSVALTLCPTARSQQSHQPLCWGAKSCILPQMGGNSPVITMPQIQSQFLWSPPGHGMAAQHSQTNLQVYF